MESSSDVGAWIMLAVILVGWSVVAHFWLKKYNISEKRARSGG